MKFRKKKHRAKISRTDADIIASKTMLIDMKLGCELPLSYYDAMSDKLCNQPSRKIYEVNNV